MDEKFRHYACHFDFELHLISCLIFEFLYVFSSEHYELNVWMHRWLSGSDLKKVAVFGCPSLSRKIVFAAKALRTFFRIQENLVSHFL